MADGMTLTISILRCPDSVPPQTRKVTGGELSIGRGVENDWVLPDPDRVLSKRHCVIAFRQGAWQVADTSSNGTFVNRETDAIGPGRLHPLQDGDRLRLGSYEMELRLDEAGNSAFGPQRRSQEGSASSGSPFTPQPFLADPFGDDPFAAPTPQRNSGPFQSDPLLQNDKSNQGLSMFGSGVALPLDFDPMAPDPDHLAFSGPTQQDHTPAVADAFQPPSVSRIPDDWDLDFAAPISPQPAARVTVQETPPAAPRPAAPPPPAPLPVGGSPFDEPDVVAPVIPVAAPMARAPAPVATEVPPAPVTQEGDLFAAFLRGAEMDHHRPADPVSAMVNLGAAFRAVVSGIRQTLIARASVKSEFRIEQTMIRARGNNPLKFSAGDDDALAALLGTGRRTDMPAAEAVADALRDIRLHELATMAAMQTAVRALLKRLDPVPLREEGEKSGGMLPMQRRARAFELFEKLHADISLALADDFDSVFGKAFARAYEQALREASEKEQR
jgi:type VI secretion system protein ImpI/type VI secretion system protein